MRKRPYMEDSVLRESLNCERLTCDYCAYGTQYRKTTDWWTNLKGWVPEGNTGNGRCGQVCGQGGWAPGEGNRRHFRHHVALANEPIENVRGEGATKVINHIPAPLCNEILKVARSRAKANPTGRRPVLLDLCAGWGSMKEAALELGFHYVAVDVKNRLA